MTATSVLAAGRRLRGRVGAPMRSRWMSAAAVVLVVSALAAAGYLVVQHISRPTTISAIFGTANSIYPGDEVRIAGVKVGTITSITPQGQHVRFTLAIDHGISVAADARAIIVAPNLVSARFVQLTPAYDTGPRLGDGAQIPQSHTATPVEWDEVKRQLDRIATDLGPDDLGQSSSTGRLIDSAANAMAGNGDKLRQTLAQLSAISRILADHSGNIVDTITALQKFVSGLRDSNTQIAQFQDHLATLSTVLDGGRSDLHSALTNLSQAVGQVTQFVHGSRDQTAEQVQRLANVTQNLVDHRGNLEQVLHVAPNAFANAYNMFDPRSGGASGVFVLNNMANPALFLCGMLSSPTNVTSTETGKLCSQYLGPGLNRLNFNYLPFPVNPLLASVPGPDKVIYSDPKLQPGAQNNVDSPAPTPPALSAYAPGPPTLQQLLIPDTATGPAPAPAAPPPTEGPPS